MTGGAKRVIEDLVSEHIVLYCWQRLRHPRRMWDNAHHRGYGTTHRAWWGAEGDFEGMEV